MGSFVEALQVIHLNVAGSLLPLLLPSKPDFLLVDALPNKEFVVADVKKPFSNRSR